MLAERFTSSLVLSFWCLGEIFSAPVCQSLVLLCGVISCSHSMYNAYPKLYCLLHVCLPPHLNTHTHAHTHHLQAWAQSLIHRLLALVCFIWPHIRPISSRFMTSGVGLFRWIPRQDTIHGRCVWYLLCFQIWEPQHSRRARGAVRRNPLYFQQPASYSALSTFGSWKRKERSGQLLLHPFLNYTVVIKQHTFNHSLC